VEFKPVPTEPAGAASNQAPGRYNGTKPKDTGLKTRCYNGTVYQALSPGVVGIGFHFQYLFQMPFAVSDDKQYPLLAMQLYAHRTVGGAQAQVGGVFPQSFRLGAAFHEMFDGLFRRAVFADYTFRRRAWWEHCE
jgi:hypothetical protein